MRVLDIRVGIVRVWLFSFDGDARSRDNRGRCEIESVADDESETSDLVLDAATWLSFKNRFNLLSFPRKDRHSDESLNDGSCAHPLACVIAGVYADFLAKIYAVS